MESECGGLMNRFVSKDCGDPVTCFQLSLTHFVENKKAFNPIHTNKIDGDMKSLTTLRGFF